MQALDEFMTSAMGANSLATRLDNALKLQTYLQGGPATFSIDESHDPAFEQIIADFDRDPALFSSYFETLTRAQAMVDKFKTLSFGELKYIDHVFKHARASRIETINELFDHRTWLQVQKDRGRYALPTQDGAYARPNFKGAFRPSEARLALYFLNLEIPRPDALAYVGGTIKVQSWPIDKFDAHIQERRDEMKKAPGLQARSLFLSWFDKATPEFARMILGHTFRDSEFFKLSAEFNVQRMANIAHTFIESSAIRDTIANTDYKVPEPEITAQAEPEIVVAAKPEVEVLTAADAIANVQALLQEYHHPKTTPAVAPVEDNVVPFPVETKKPSTQRPIVPLNMSATGAKITKEELFPSYERDPIVVTPRKPAPVSTPKMVAAVLPMHPRRKPGALTRRFLAVAAIVVATLGVGATQYEPVRSAGAQTLKSVWNDVTGETRREQERAARIHAEAQKPIIKPKIADRYGDPVRPTIRAAVTPADPYQPKPVKTTVEPGYGINGLMRNTPR